MVIENDLRKKGNLIYETVHIASDGKKIPVEINSVLFDFNCKTMVLATSRKSRGASGRKMN
jgi:hypothetical protein